MTREEYRRTVKSGGMHTTRDVYGNPRFIIHVFGGGFVFQVYGLDLLIDELYNDIYKKDR